MKNLLIALFIFFALVATLTPAYASNKNPLDSSVKQFQDLNVCPQGNVKANYSGSGGYIYEYNDGTGYITGTNRTIYFGPLGNYEVGAVCVKAGQTIYDVDPDSSPWTVPGQQDISHVVLYTTELEVVLNSFEASCPSGTFIQIDWETASETSTLGFNLYRQEVGDSNWVQVNADMIPSQAPGGGGASYSYEDEGIALGLEYIYRLDAIGFDGSSVELAQVGPVKCGQPTAVGISTITTEGIQINIDKVLPFVVAFMLIAAAAFLMLGRRN